MNVTFGFLDVEGVVEGVPNQSAVTSQPNFWADWGGVEVEGVLCLPAIFPSAHHVMSTGSGSGYGRYGVWGHGCKSFGYDPLDGPQIDPNPTTHPIQLFSTYHRLRQSISNLQGYFICS